MGPPVMMSRHPVCLALAVALAASGCAPRVVAPEFAVETAAPYQLASGDRLRVIVFGQDNLSNIYAVDGSGRISMPLIGAVEAQGRTTQQLESGRSRRACAPATCASPRSRSRLTPTGRSSCSARSPIPGSSRS